MSDEFDTELLISLVEARPVLWDKTLDEYKDRNKTKNAWTEVCTQMREDFESLSDAEKNAFGKEMIRKWGTIRDCWMKSTKKLKKEKISGAGASKHKKYIYNDLLKFLAKLNTQKPTANSLDHNTSGQSQETQETICEREIEDNDAGDSFQAVAAQTSKQDQQRQRTSRKRKPDDLELRMIKALEAGTEQNRHLSFFKGVIPSLNTLTDDQTIEFQMGVLQLIKNIKRRARTANFSGNHLSQTNFPCVTLPQIANLNSPPYPHQQRVSDVPASPFVTEGQAPMPYTPTQQTASRVVFIFMS